MVRVSSKANSWKYLQQAIRIDAEIKSLEESVRASVRTLRRRRNALAPISSLPIELIADIFSLLRLPDTSLALPILDVKNKQLAWMRVAHVCHQWREIALNTPLLWRHVDFANIT
jgi:hypothetical protein